MANEYYVQDDPDEYQDDVQPDGNMDPAKNVTVSNFDNETLQYLENCSVDDTMDFLLDRLKSVRGKMTKDCVNDIEMFIRTFFSKEFVLTNITKSDVDSRRLDLRVSYMFLKGKTRAINTSSGEFQYIMSLVETKFINKLSRSVNGFERKTQNTQHVTSTSTRLVGNNTPPRTGLSRIGRNTQ